MLRNNNITTLIQMVDAENIKGVATFLQENVGFNLNNYVESEGPFFNCSPLNVCISKTSISETNLKIIELLLIHGATPTYSRGEYDISPLESAIDRQLNHVLLLFNETNLIVNLAVMNKYVHKHPKALNFVLERAAISKDNLRSGIFLAFFYFNNLIELFLRRVDISELKCIVFYQLYNENKDSAFNLLCLALSAGLDPNTIVRYETSSTSLWHLVSVWRDFSGLCELVRAGLKIDNDDELREVTENLDNQEIKFRGTSEHIDIINLQGLFRSIRNGKKVEITNQPRANRCIKLT